MKSGRREQRNCEKLGAKVWSKNMRDPLYLFMWFLGEISHEIPSYEIVMKGGEDNGAKGFKTFQLTVSPVVDSI